MCVLVFVSGCVSQQFYHKLSLFLLFWFICVVTRGITQTRRAIVRIWDPCDKIVRAARNGSLLWTRWMELTECLYYGRVEKWPIYWDISGADWNRYEIREEHTHCIAEGLNTKKEAVSRRTEEWMFSPLSSTDVYLHVQWILGKQSLGVWIGLFWLRIRNGNRLLWSR
jgi:hypothetical protein